MRVEDDPPRYRGLYRKAMSGRSRRASIRAHCLMCRGWQSTEVEQCTAPMCPLYRYRLGAATTESAGGPEIVASPETSIMQVLSSAKALDGAPGTPGRPGAKLRLNGGLEATCSAKRRRTLCNATRGLRAMGVVQVPRKQRGEVWP